MRFSRNHQFAAFSLVMLVTFHDPLHKLISFSFSSHLFFYILLIPFVSLYFFCVRKEKIFSNVTYSFPAGGLITLAGIVLYLIEKKIGPLVGPADSLSVMAPSFLLTWVGGFIFFYGIQAFRQALFPLAFLLLMVPIPSVILEQIIVILQKCSAETAGWIFNMTGLPVQKDGFVFSLSQVEIEVAKQCSGIRSSLYLFITSLVFSQLYLKTPTRRALLILSVIPITIFKNGLRIVTLALLGNYVHEAILSSDLHRRGGIPFMIVAVILLSVVVKWLQKTENHTLPVEIPKA